MEGNISDNGASALLKTLDEIRPEKLGTTSYARYMRQIKDAISTPLLTDSTNLLIVIETIKSCRSACFKRDILIEVLDHVIFSSTETLRLILRDNLQKGISEQRWKDMSNALATLPDLIANCDSLEKFTRFKNDLFYTHLLEEIYFVLKEISQNNGIELIGTNQVCFFVQLIGRISISGFSTLVWKIFTFKAMTESCEKLRNMIANMITFPLHNNNQISSHFEMYIEPLYFPYFSNLKPSKNSGKLIKSILGDSMTRHDSFEYFICNKSILQTNYSLKRHRQYTILFNIFSYLADLNNSEDSSLAIEEEKEKNKDTSLENKSKRSNLLIKTLLEVARSWSNSTKILFRPYEQNRYISSALLIGFRLALEKNKHDLARSADEIQSAIIQGFPTYLNRASFQHRNLSMCLGEILLPRLCELISSTTTDSKKEKQTLNFDVEWDDDTEALKELFYGDVEKLFDLENNENLSNALDITSQVQDASSSKTSKDIGSKCSRNNISKGELPIVPKMANVEGIKSGVFIGSSSGSCTSSNISLSTKDHRHHHNKQHSSKRAIIVEVDSDSSDDLLPYETKDDVDDCDIEEDEACAVDKDIMNVPIYLRDCINGLAENNSPNYVRLCLIKAGELTEQLLLADHEAEHRISSTINSIDTRARSLKLNDDLGKGDSASIHNDAIRDIAIELTQTLLYLDDQFNIDAFDMHRMKALCSISIAAPDLVVKYLLDEFNGTNRNTRHQLDILQVLVMSAQHISGNIVLMNKKNDEQQQQNGNSVVVGSSSSDGGRNRDVGGGGNSSSNKFVKYVSLYFYGIVHQLKADLTSNILLTQRLVQKDNDNSRLDDSYLLSRIFFSISEIIKCVYQQPITCKLSNDLLDILAAYRCHPDSGVRKSIVSCLTVIKECTASVYFKEFLYDKTVRLFADWLAKEADLIQLSRLTISKDK